MTRKDYNRAAKIVRDYRTTFSKPGMGRSHDEVQKTTDAIENAFVDFFQEDNPRFDAYTFRQLCK